MAPEAINKNQVWGDPHVNEKERLFPGAGNDQGIEKDSWKTVPLTVKALPVPMRAAPSLQLCLMIFRQQASFLYKIYLLPGGKCRSLVCPY